MHPSSAHSDRKFPTRRELREAQRKRHTTVHTPMPRFERATTPDESASEPKKSRTVGQRIVGGFALVCVLGIAVSYSLPLITAVAASPADASVAQLDPSVDQQALFSEVSLNDLPTSLEDIEYVVSDKDAKADYVFNPDAIVNHPFAGPVTLTDGFGYRTAPVAQFHDAQDYAAAAGTAISAIADGTVLEAGMADDGCGFGLRIAHTISHHEVTSRYCHMVVDSHAYAEGDLIKMGDPVGQVGNTGLSFGPHLHLSIKIDDKPTDPVPFLAKWSKVMRADLEAQDNDTEEAEASRDAQYS